MRGPGPGSCALAEPTAPPADRPAIDREQAEALHGEIDRLPQAVPPAGGALLLRGPHARRGRPAAPLPGRHAPQPAGPARDKLRVGLARRGVVLPAAALAAVLAPRSASASIPPLLCDTTTRAAIALRGPSRRRRRRSPPRRRPWPRRSSEPC